MPKRRKQLRTLLAVAMVAALFIGTAGIPASAEDVTPRILFVGDSWTGFMLAFKSFRTVFPEYEGLDRWVEVGNRTAEMGGRVWEMLERNYLQIVTEELTRYPNIDIVVMTLGGNDIMRGVKGASPSQPTRTVSLRTCFESNPANEPWADFDECMEWISLKLEEQIGIVVDNILSIRPDIRVVILSYDYAAREPRDESYTIEDQHLAFIEVEMAKRNLALARPRVEYVNNFGLMQHLYGIPEAEPPIAPGVAPYPCDAPGAECAFWPGGFPQYLSPLLAYIDQDIHLTDFGYADIARRAVDQHIEEWLNFPKALEILPLDNKAPQYQFQVTFSHPVNGVAMDDFEVFIEEKSELKAMSVIGVQPTAGPTDTYVVTVDMDGSQQVAYIRVLDDDSITRADTGIPLGGPGVGNGFFEYNGLYEFQDIPNPTDEDFAGALQFLYMASMAYDHLLGQYGFSFNPDFFDANGQLLRDGSLEDPYIIPGNGILDLYEFMVIDAVLKRPDLDLSATGGLTYGAVRYAWDSNIASVQAALGGVGGLADIILPGLDTMLAGFQTVGDRDSNFLVTTLITLLGAIQEFPTNLNPAALPYYDTMSPDPDIFLRRWLAFSGDADGDGWRNHEEYAYFAPDGMAAYVNAVLDPTLTPKTGEGRYNIGDFVRIAVLTRPTYNSTFQWYRNGVPLENKDVRIVGANSRALDILSLEPGDSGDYTCVYNRWVPVGAYPQDTYGPIKIQVREGPIPVGGALMLTLLALTVGAGGVHVIRRRR